MRTRDRQRVVGECLLWALAVAYVGNLAFGEMGRALGLVAAALHGLLRARAPRTPRWVLALWHLVFLPATMAVILASTPILETWIVLVPLLFVLWAATPVPARLTRRGSTRPAHSAALAALVATLWVCAELPLKELDHIVGPAQYRALTLPKLCDRLRRDHGVICRVWEPVLMERVVDFTIPHPMTRREVLHKLASDTGLRLQIASCGTGSTLLWGSYPAFTYLSSGEVP